MLTLAYLVQFLEIRLLNLVLNVCSIAFLHYMVIVTFHRSLKSIFMDLSVFIVFGSILAICMKYDPLWFYLENAYEAKSLSVSHSVHKTKVIKPGRPMIWKKKPFMSPPPTICQIDNIQNII